MGFLSGIHHRVSADYDGIDRGPLSDFWYAPEPWVTSFQNTGIMMTPEVAMTLSALWHGVTFFAKNLGSLPCITYRNKDDDSRELAKNFPLYTVLKNQPNETQSAFEFWEMAVGHVLLRGNFYAEIVPGTKGFVDQLIPLHPDRVSVDRLPSGRLQYTVKNANLEDETYTQDQIFHVRGYSIDGMTGVSMIAYAANSLATAVAADQYAGKFFKSGATAALAVRHPGTLGEDGLANLRESIKKYLYGAKNAGGVLVLEEDAKIEKIGISPQDAQILSTREHSIREVAHWLGLPMQIFATGQTNTTFASAYQFRLDLIDFAFRPMAVRFEQAIRRQLIMRKDLYAAEFLMDAILRGDLKARSEFYHLAISDGWMSRNEVRRKENLNKEDGLDEFLQPMNMGQVDEKTDTDENDEADQDAADEAKARARHFQMRASVLALEAAQRVVRKEIAAVTRNAERLANDSAGWSTWLREFYSDHANYVAQTLRIPMHKAREYAAQQGLQLQSTGVAAMTDWEAVMPTHLALIALDGATR